MHLRRMGSVILLLILAALALSTTVVVGQESTPVHDTTMIINKSGAIHFKIVDTLPATRDGVTGSHFELQKQFRPENVSVYDYATGQPLEYTKKDLESVVTYDVSFRRPYYEGYSYVVEYDNHNKIVDEGKGVYSIGFRPGVDIHKIRRVSTVVFPPENFTYLDYNHALDPPVSVEQVEGSTVLKFDNTSSAPADYAWEIKFRAIDIKDELVKPKSGTAKPLPGLTVPGTLIALAAGVVLYSKRRG